MRLALGNPDGSWRNPKTLPLEKSKRFRWLTAATTQGNHMNETKRFSRGNKPVFLRMSEDELDIWNKVKADFEGRLQQRLSHSAFAVEMSMIMANASSAHSET